MATIRVTNRITNNLRNFSINTLSVKNEFVSSSSRSAVPSSMIMNTNTKFYSSLSTYNNISPITHIYNLHNVRNFSQDASQTTTNNGTENNSTNTNNNSQTSSTSQDPKDTRITELTTEIEALKKKLAQAEKDRLYQAAEMENVRRIAKNDVAKIKEYAAQPLAKSLLLAVDNINSALKSIPPKATEGNKPFADLVEGLQATQKIFMKVLGEHGVNIFGSIGEKFDFNKHEAVTSVPTTEGKEPNTVASVFQQGYTFKDRILRPAQVAVYAKQ